MNNGNEGSDVLGDSQQRYRCPWAEIGTNQIAGFVTEPSEKK